MEDIFHKKTITKLTFYSAMDFFREKNRRLNINDVLGVDIATEIQKTLMELAQE